MQKLKVGFISTRFHGTDGVTLEAAKWGQVLEQDGHACFWYAGKLDTPEEVSFLCEEAFFDHPDVLALQEQMYGTRVRSRELTDAIHAMRERLKDSLYAFIEKFGIDVIVPQNILAIPMHVPLGLAMTEVIAETRIPTIAHHHDFVWERVRFLNNCVPDYLDMAFPPSFAGRYRSVVINSSAQTDLARRAGLPSTLVPNVFDFENPPAALDAYASDVREEFGIGGDELFILQPTRVVPRKGIEQAIELVRQIQNPNRPVCLVVSHDAGDEGFDYYDLLVERAREAGIRMLFVGERVTEVRGVDGHGRKTYTLWDIYHHADFVTYPSLYEGFGNAFLEALYFRKPILVNEYSIYTRDIKPLGFKVVEMDGVVTQSVSAEVERVLGDAVLREEWAEHNYQLGVRYFSYGTLRGRLRGLLGELFGEV